MLFVGRGIASGSVSPEMTHYLLPGFIAFAMNACLKPKAPPAVAGPEGTQIPQGKPHCHFWNRTSPEARLLLNVFAPRFTWRSKNHGGKLMSSPSVAPGRQTPVFSRAIPLSWVLLLALLVHGPLLLMQIPNDSYDAYLHQFFASHYAHHWFNPWNEKWFTGFSQTTYPPLEQQWIALFSHVLGLKLAYMVVQFIAILLLPIGVYRYARIWVSERAASYAA